jgi:hypothetical protein
MDWFKNFNMGAWVIIVGAISTIGWITVGGTIALVISILAGSSVALKGTLDQED